MEVEDALRMMRDPLGAPFYPRVFQVLLLLTWVVHIYFVTVAVGSSVTTIYGFRRGDERWLRLARSCARLTPSGVGLGIVTGIAPLLFVQVIYDPIWYASNALTGFWSVIFIIVVASGYTCAYVFYLKGSADGRLLWSSVLGLALLVLAGWIMHVLASVSIRPERWREWYAPNGVADTRGIEFHSFNVARVAFLLPLQAAIGTAVTGLIYTWYRLKRDDADREYLTWVAGLSRRLGIIASVLYGGVGIAWAVTEGADYDLTAPMAIALGGVGLAMAAFFAAHRDPVGIGRRALGAWFASLAVVAVIREVIRATALSRFNYDVGSYPYRVDWGSVAMFTVTTIVGVSIITYMVMVLFQSGIGAGERIPRSIDRLGRVSTAMLGAWFAFFLLVGVYAVVAL